MSLSNLFGRVESAALDANRVGYTKVAAELLRAERLDVPDGWSLPEIGRVLGTKLAYDMLQRAQIAEGIVALVRVTR